LLAPSFFLFVLLWNVPDAWLLAQQNSLLSFLFALLGEFYLVNFVGSQKAPASSRAGTKPAMKSCKENRKSSWNKNHFLYRTNEKLQAKYIM